MLCTTILVVLATTIVQGSLTEPLIRWLGVKIGVDMAEYVQVRCLTHVKLFSNFAAYNSCTFCGISNARRHSEAKAE